MTMTDSQRIWDDQLAEGIALVADIRAQASACEDPERRRLLRWQAPRLETGIRKTREWVEARRAAEVSA